jgi:hypothetical protein
MVLKEEGLWSSKGGMNKESKDNRDGGKGVE